MNQSTDLSLREHLVSLLTGGSAHLSFEDFIKDFPVEKCGEQIEGIPYTAWQVLEHMRIAQWDILEFSRAANHVSPKWPEGYWPNQDDVGDAAKWNTTVERFRDDLQQMEDLINDPATDLFARIPHGSGQTILREALLVADHNAYHPISATRTAMPRSSRAEPNARNAIAHIATAELGSLKVNSHFKENHEWG